MGKVLHLPPVRCTLKWRPLPHCNPLCSAQGGSCVENHPATPPSGERERCGRQGKKNKGSGCAFLFLSGLAILQQSPLTAAAVLWNMPEHCQRGRAAMPKRDTCHSQADRECGVAVGPTVLAITTKMAELLLTNSVTPQNTFPTISKLVFKRCALNQLDISIVPAQEPMSARHCQEEFKLRRSQAIRQTVVLSAGLRQV